MAEAEKKDKPRKTLDLYIQGNIDVGTLNLIPPIRDAPVLDYDLNLYISTFGGSTDVALALIIAMQEVKPYVTVSTIGLGFVYSAGIYLISAGTPGHRKAYDKTIFMTHKTRLALSGTSDEVKEGSAGVEMVEDALLGYFAEDTGVDPDTARGWIDTVNYFDVKEAKKINLINKIITIG